VQQLKRFFGYFSQSIEIMLLMLASNPNLSDILLEQLMNFNNPNSLWALYCAREQQVQNIKPTTLFDLL
jgi:hypothetical protein